MSAGRRCQGAGRYAVQCRRTGEPTASVPGHVEAFFCHDHEAQRAGWEHHYYYSQGYTDAAARYGRRS